MRLSCVKKLLKATKELLAAQLELDDFRDDYPCPDAYDEEQSKTWETLKNDKWDAVEEIRGVIRELEIEPSITIFVVTMLDKNEDYNHGIYNCVEKNITNAKKRLRRLVEEEIKNGSFTIDDVTFSEDELMAEVDVNGHHLRFTIDEHTIHL